MTEHLYWVWFVDVGIKIHATAVIGEIAISNAEKELKGKYGNDIDLGKKVNVWRVDGL